MINSESIKRFDLSETLTAWEKQGYSVKSITLGNALPETNEVEIVIRLGRFDETKTKASFLEYIGKNG